MLQCFVGIQHPREGLKGSTFPYGKTPRSSVMMIRKHLMVE
ncbi:TPA: hypothetical protein ACV1PY_001765 [Campylobacter jejuni]